MPASVDTKDLKRLEQAIKLFAVRLPDEGEKVLAKTAKSMAGDAASKVMSRPGSRGSYHREPEAYDTAKRSGAHAVDIQGGGTAIAAEYGATYHYVFGRRVTAKSMKRRVFGARIKRWSSGKVVGKLIKADLPAAEKRLAIAFNKDAERVFDRLGL